MNINDIRGIGRCLASRRDIEICNHEMFHELQSIFSFAVAKNRPRFFLSTLPALKHKLAHQGGQVSDFPICTVATLCCYPLWLHCVASLCCHAVHTVAILFGAVTCSLQYCNNAFR